MHSAATAGCIMRVEVILLISHPIILHFSLIEGIGPTAVQSIVDGKPPECSWQDMYTFLPSDFVAYGFTPQIASALVAGLADRYLLEREQELIERHNIQVVTLLDAHYPALLRHIYAPPAVLYFQGAALHTFEHNIAFVGARKADAYGKRVVETLVPPLVERGWTVVSGGALGIDSMAHKVTVESGGKTIAILGSGLLEAYPISNKKLFESIVDAGGALVSAFPLRVAPLPGNFPARNRIISGLSRGCVVVQAARTSGARITANYALEQGRQVFAVPGMIDNVLSVGCHDLIQLGAKLVMHPDDISEELDPGFKRAVDAYGGGNTLITEAVVTRDEQKKISFLPPKGVELKSSKSAVEEDISAHCYEKDSIQAKIMALCEHPQGVDDLVRELSGDLMQLQNILFEMQMDGVIKQDFMGRWSRMGE
jgi:DNA processing protein